MAWQALWIVRMIFWLALAAATAWLLWYMVKVPGVSYAGALKPLTEEERIIVGRLRTHVAAIAGSEHNFLKAAELEAAARYIEQALAGTGLEVATQSLVSGPGEVRNIEVEVRGGAAASEIIIVGAHYDSVLGAPGANDNASGVAAVIELARLFAAEKPTRTLRFVAFVNEEPPFYHSDAMGSRHYARRSR
ncbi:MAG: M28 family peptidase, partial [Burkholderiales bacterium]